MNNNSRCKNAFTLIEVMVAVMIISIVILAMLQMYANNVHIFSSLRNQVKTNQYTLVLLGNENNSLESKKVLLYDLVRDFDIRDELRRELREKRIHILYTKVKYITLSKRINNDSSNIDDLSIVLELGKSIIKTKQSSFSLQRIKF